MTFAEVRRHLGVETQRKWTDRAIARTTPMLLALFSLITLFTEDIHKARTIVVRSARWYAKEAVAFSDALAAVRRQLWTDQTFAMSQQDRHPRIDRRNTRPPDQSCLPHRLKCGKSS
ncbi:hypothetical protein [uncultured Sphingomonas sp.]|uniref:hypothetical protein n=1 Tax=uncultured Sphingomonas sp. TaxID=158754 RepID=UPI0035CC9C70